MAVVVAPQAASPLSTLPLGLAGCIERVNAPRALTDRLEGLGLCVGRTVRLIKRGDPFIVNVYGTRIGVAAHIAAQIEVSY